MVAIKANQEDVQKVKKIGLLDAQVGEFVAALGCARSDRRFCMRLPLMYLRHP